MIIKDSVPKVTYKSYEPLQGRSWDTVPKLPNETFDAYLAHQIVSKSSIE